MNDIPMYKKVHAYVTDHNILQNDIARELNTSPQKISFILNGKRKLKVDDLEKIMDFLNVTWDTLYNYEVEDG